jgi:hypothetical protein
MLTVTPGWFGITRTMAPNRVVGSATLGMEGTPPNFNVPKLEKLPTKPRPLFLVPEGVSNVAMNKKVTTSSSGRACSGCSPQELFGILIETYEGKLIDTKGVKARQVRLFSAGNNANKLNHYVEVEVFGRLAK